MVKSDLVKYVTTGRPCLNYFKKYLTLCTYFICIVCKNKSPVFKVNIFLNFPETLAAATVRWKYPVGRDWCDTNAHLISGRSISGNCKQLTQSDRPEWS